MKDSCPGKAEQPQCDCSKLSPLNNSPADTTCFSRRAFEVMSDINERWSENNRPFAFRQALAVLLAHFASIRSHDAARVHRSSGFPLKFVSMVIFELSHNTLWHSCEGYADLVRIIEKRQGVEEFDSVLGQMINSLFENATDDALEDEWDRAMGVKIGL